jgi:hypothetical protein
MLTTLGIIGFIVLLIIISALPFFPSRYRYYDDHVSPPPNFPISYERMYRNDYDDYHYRHFHYWHRKEQAQRAIATFAFIIVMIILLVAFAASNSQ